MSRLQVRAFLANHPGAAARLLALLGAFGFGAFAWYLIVGDDPRGAFLAACVAIVLVVVASGEGFDDGPED